MDIGIDDFGTGLLVARPTCGSCRSASSRSTAPSPDASTSPAAPRLVEAIVSLGRSLGLEIIAEGVESRRQVESLVRMGCGIAQGHLFARPAPADSITVHGDSEVDLSWP